MASSLAATTATARSNPNSKSTLEATKLRSKSFYSFTLTEGDKAISLNDPNSRKTPRFELFRHGRRPGAPAIAGARKLERENERCEALRRGSGAFYRVRGAGRDSRFAGDVACAVVGDEDVRE